MVFDQMRTKLLAKGYTTDTANAKIAHDVVLDAVREAGFHDNVTVKGGVVMSGLENEGTAPAGCGVFQWKVTVLTSY